MIESLLISLALTLVLEITYALLWGVGETDMPLILAMNVLTNPLVVLWNIHFGHFGYLVGTIIPELGAISAEAVLLCHFGKQIRRPVILAICVNVFSYFTGVLLQFVFREGLL